jgi:hypothetical protein
MITILEKTSNPAIIAADCGGTTYQKGSVFYSPRWKFLAGKAADDGYGPYGPSSVPAAADLRRTCLSRCGRIVEGGRTS